MASRKRQRRITVAKVAGFSIWTAVVALFLLWQTIDYMGIMSLVGEWQFNAFGRQYPTFNYVFLVFILCLPGYLVFLRPRQRSGGERSEAAVFRSARAFLTAVVAGAAGLGAAVLAILIAMLMLPNEDSGPLQRIDLTRSALIQPHEGPAELSGAILYDRTAGFDKDLLLTRRTFRFAPVVAARDNTNELQFFVQLPPVDDRTRGGAITMKGVLKRNGLPGEIVRLFRYAGFQVDQPNWVLFVEPAAMRWPYLITMVQFAIGALLALGFALLQRARVRRIDHDVHDKPVAT